jgi:hypothetical protein
MTMDGRQCPDGMTPEQFAEAQRVFEISQKAAQDELWRMACLTSTKEDGEMLGETEFQMRDILLRIGANAIQAAVNERRKKGGTQAAALPAVNANITPVSSDGEKRRS